MNQTFFAGSPLNSHNRCFFTEHSLKGDGRITYFYQICRVIYTKSRAEVSLLVQLPLHVKKKTFAPSMLPPTGEETESRFESFTKTVERVSSWLDNTGRCGGNTWKIDCLICNRRTQLQGDEGRGDK